MNGDERGPDDSGTAAPARTPPYSERSEEALLGAAILSRKALAVLATVTRPEDFYVPKHQAIAFVLADFYRRGDDYPTDPVSVAEELRRRGDLEGIGGATELVRIQGACPSTTSAGRYAQIVHDHATRRRTIAAGAAITELGYSEGGDVHATVLRAHEVLGGVAAQNGSRSYSGFELADVAGLIEGGLDPEDADFLTRTDGKALLYAGKMHMFQAEPTSGKTWLALAAVLELLEVGGSAVYLDYEDAPKGLLGRLLALGADPDAVRERFRYAQIIGPCGPPERAELFALLSDLNPDLVVIDGVAEALARDGLSEDSATDFVGWVERLPRPIARTGAAVLLLDHVAKDKENQGRWARGTGAKLGVIDGASYHVKVATPFSRRRSGIIRLVIAKDRPGGVGAVGETAAIAYVDPHADGARVVVRLEPDTGDRSVADAWRPTVLMRRVSEELERSGQAVMVRTLKSLVHSEKPKLLEEAIGRLEQEGYIARTKLGRSVAYQHVRPFTADDPRPDVATGSTAPPTADDAPPDLFDSAGPEDLEAWKAENF